MTRFRRLPQPLWCALPAIALAVCALLPFLGKAYTIDDTLFLRQAEQALQDPLHPSAFDYQWSGASVPRRVSKYMPSGPVMAYLLVPAVLVRNGEWVGHAVQLLFLIGGSVAAASIALRLGYGGIVARLTALLLVASPAVLAMTATCMPDTVAMALGAIGIERTLAWRDTRRWAPGALAAIALALSIATRSHCAMLLIPAFVLAVFGGQDLPGTSWLRERAIAALPVLAAPLLAAACFRVARDPATSGSVLWSIKALARVLWRDNLYAFMFHQSLALPFGAGMFLAGLRGFRPDALLLVALPAAFAFGFRRANGDLFLIVPAALTLAAFLRAAITGWLRSRSTAVALALWLLAPLPVIFYVQLPSKYLLVSAPAAALFLAAALSARSTTVRRVIASALVVAGTVVGLLVVRADSHMSGLARDAARAVVEPAVRSGIGVWFDGHWGFQWYMEQAGAKPLAIGARPAAQDLIVVSRNAREDEMASGCADCRLIGVLEEPAPGGRIMAGGAGFYSNAWGAYPWVWSASPDERIEVWRVRTFTRTYVRHPCTGAPLHRSMTVREGGTD